MKSIELLVTTAQHLWHVSYRPKDMHAESKIIWSKHGLFFGCDWNRDSIFVSARGGYGREISPRGEMILKFDRDLSFDRIWYRSKQLADSHQLCVVDNQIWVTNTFYNTIHIVNLKTRSATDFAPRGKKGRPGDGKLADWNHYNTLRFDGKKVYLIACNLKTKVSPRLRKSELLVLDPKRLHLDKSIRLQGKTAHDIWREKGEWRSCDSKRGVICSHRSEQRLRLLPWLRGISIIGDHLFAGVSTLRKRHETAADGSETPGTILILDRKTNQLKGHVLLPKTGQVNDIMVLNHPDLARFNKRPIWK